MLRTVWFLFWGLIITLIFSILGIISGLINPFGRFANWVIRTWARLLLFFAGVKVKVEGKENIKEGRPYVYMSNHLSTFDIPASIAFIPGTARFVAKKELFKVPFFGQGMNLVGIIKIDRGNSAEARKTIEKAAETVNSGVSVIFYPEGTRSEDGNVQSFKKGGFVLALNGGIPIVPIAINGSRDIMKKKSLRLNPGAIRMQFLPPVETQNYNYEERNALVKEVRERIIEAYEKGRQAL